MTSLAKFLSTLALSFIYWCGNKHTPFYPLYNLITIKKPETVSASSLNHHLCNHYYIWRLFVFYQRCDRHLVLYLLWRKWSIRHSESLDHFCMLLEVVIWSIFSARWRILDKWRIKKAARKKETLAKNRIMGERYSLNYFRGAHNHWWLFGKW